MILTLPCTQLLQFLLDSCTNLPFFLPSPTHVHSFSSEMTHYNDIFSHVFFLQKHYTSAAVELLSFSSFSSSFFSLFLPLSPHPYSHPSPSFSGSFSPSPSHFLFQVTGLIQNTEAHAFLLFGAALSTGFTLMKISIYFWAGTFK